MVPYLLALLPVIFLSGLTVQADVYDGGTYSESKMNASLESLGGRSGYAIPYEAAYADDRDHNAQADRGIYVFGDDHVCYRAKFSAEGPEKSLVVFSQPVFPAMYCVYQKKHSEDVAGFSIFTQDGGLCMPTYSDASVKDFNSNSKENLQVVNHRVSFRYCMDHTVSYGEIFDKKPPLKEVKEVKTVVLAHPISDEVKIPKKSDHKPTATKSEPHPVLAPPSFAQVSPFSNFEKIFNPTDITEKQAAKEKSPKAQTKPRNVASVTSDSVTPSDLDSHKFTIQLASFASTDEAVASVKSFKSRGVDAFELVQTSQGKIRHRVCVGTFDDMKTAQQSLNEINKKSIAQAFVQMIHPPVQSP